MKGPPTVPYDVRGIQNAGWPTEREFYGHGAPMVVDGVTSIQEDGNAVYRAKWGRSVSLLKILTYAKCGK